MTCPTIEGRCAAIRTLLALAPLLGLACSTTMTNLYVAAGEPPLCEVNPNLGRVIVVAETAWRPNQKDVAEREAMVERSLAEVLGALPCGQVEIDSLTAWADRSEQAVLSALAARGAQTAVLVRIEELTPQLALTFSVPFLWASTSEADFRLRALGTADGSVMLDARVRRFTGGPFQLRPAKWAEDELTAGLAELVGASLPEDP